MGVAARKRKGESVASPQSGQVVTLRGWNCGGCLPWCLPENAAIATITEGVRQVDRVDTIKEIL